MLWRALLCATWLLPGARSFLGGARQARGIRPLLGVKAPDDSAREPIIIDVVFTHTMADFDSLASAAGLAKLWAHEEVQEKGRSNKVKQVVVAPETAVDIDTRLDLLWAEFLLAHQNDTL